MSPNKKRKRPVSPAQGASGSGLQDLNAEGQAVKEVAALRGIVEAARLDPPPPSPSIRPPSPGSPSPGPAPCPGPTWPNPTTPGAPWGRWVDRDTNGCLNLQRVGESMQRPLELCSYEGLEALPTVGAEYKQGYTRVNDRLPKGRQRLHRAAEYRRGIDGRARSNA